MNAVTALKTLCTTCGGHVFLDDDEIVCSICGRRLGSVVPDLDDDEADERVTGWPREPAA